MGFDRGVWLSGRQMFAMPEFHRQYRLVTLEARDGTRARVFVRADGRAGVRRSRERVVVPGMLFARGEAVARLDAEDRLVVAIPPGARVSASVELEPGRWRARVVPADGVEWEVPGAPRDGGEIVVRGSTATMELRAEHGAEVRSVVMTRR